MGRIKNILKNQCLKMTIEVLNILSLPGLKKMVCLDNLLFQNDLDKLQSKKPFVTIFLSLYCYFKLIIIVSSLMK
jgi:hypothetical protein